MRKFFEKFAVLMQAVVSTLFVIFIILLLTGVLDKADFHNNLVYILFGTFIAIHFIFTVLVLYFQYSADVLSSVQIYSDNGGKTKLSINVIRKIIKHSVKNISGVNVRRSSVSYDEKGLILNNPVMVKNRELSGAVEEIRNTIIRIFREKLSLEFVAVNFKVISYKYEIIQNKTAVYSGTDSGEINTINNDCETGAIINTDTPDNVTDADSDGKTDNYAAADAILPNTDNSAGVISDVDNMDNIKDEIAFTADESVIIEKADESGQETVSAGKTASTEDTEDLI